jgi:hypothetical protein
LVESVGVCPPLSVESVDRDGDAGLPYRDRLSRHGGGLGASEAERTEPSLLSAALCFVGG